MLHHRLHVILLSIVFLIELEYEYPKHIRGNEIHCLISITYQIYLFLAQQWYYPAIRPSETIPPSLKSLWPPPLPFTENPTPLVGCKASSCLTFFFWFTFSPI